MPNIPGLIKSSLSKNVLSNSKIVSNLDLNQDYVYHISKTKHSKNVLVPNISRRLFDDEDNTCLRVSVSLNLMDCISGYGDCEQDVINTFLYDDEEFTNNGYYIYRVKFTHLVKPNKKLIKEVPYTNEHWLVRYDNNSITYDAELIGRMFINNISMDTLYDSSPVVICSFMVSVDVPIPLTTSTMINDYCQFTWDRYTDYVVHKHCSDNNDDKLLSFNNISKLDYYSKKKISATMLSLDDNRPKFLNLE